MSSALDPVRRTLAEQRHRFQRGGRPAMLWALRLTVAAVSSYVVAQVIFPGTRPLLAPLTALLVVQVTPVSLLASGKDRVVAVVAGVSLAVVFASVLPLSWWSLGLLIATSLLVGQVIRLRDNLIEVAISAMLVLGVGSFNAEAAAWQRVTETLVGAAVGIAANLLFPPKVASADAGKALDDLADDLSRLLVRAADDLAELGGVGDEVAVRASGWLDDARAITDAIPTVGAAVLRAEQGRRLNVRAVGTADVGPGLRQGLESLEHSAVALRSMFRAVYDATYDDTWPDDEVGAASMEGLEQVLRELADGVAAFGELVRAESRTQRNVTPEITRVQAGLDGLFEARARLNELLLADTAPVLFELHAAVLATVKRLLREMSFEERVRRQLQLQPRTPRGRIPHPTGRAPLRPDGPARPPDADPEEPTQLI